MICEIGFLTKATKSSVQFEADIFFYLKYAIKIKLFDLLFCFNRSEECVVVQACSSLFEENH